MCRFAAMQSRLKVQVFIVTLTEQPFSCMASNEQVLGYLATHMHCLTSACFSGCEYGEHSEHSGQVRWTAGGIAPPVSVYY